MTKQLFFTALLVLTAKTIFAVAFSFRVQCSTDSKDNLLAVYNQIPERKAYTLPTGATLYFSGGYFFTLEEAIDRLDQVRKLGIEDAFIRVFKNRSFLSQQVSSVLLAQLMLDYEKPKVLYDTAYMAVTKAKITQKNKRYYNIVEPDLSNNQQKQKLEEKASSSVATGSKKVMQLAAIAAEDKPQIKESVEELGSHVNVKVLPQYKILIAKKNVKDLTPKVLEQVDEIIYETKNGNIVYYTVGYFESHSQASAGVSLYKKSLRSEDVKVVGLYNGSVVSEGLAQDLEKLYYQQKKK